MRVPFLCGNWKMNKTAAETRQFMIETKVKVANAKGIELGIAAPFTSLAALVEACKGSNIRPGAQNCHWAKTGAFTGEVSADMLVEIGVQFVIIGHSERRQYFAETDETVNKRLIAVLGAGLDAIVCVGETEKEREENQTDAVVIRQIKAALAGVTAEQAKKITIAYEPVWAIGTGKSADENDAQAVHALIRGLLKEAFGQEVADGIRIQYGGSVKPDNIAKYLQQADIDGGLVGGASLTSDGFAAMVNALQK